MGDSIEYKGELLGRFHLKKDGGLILVMEDEKSLAKLRRLDDFDELVLNEGERKVPYIYFEKHLLTKVSEVYTSHEEYLKEKFFKEED